MAGKIRHLLVREGRYHARIVVPLPLRPYVGKSELLEALGPDRREANRLLPRVIAKFQDQLADARERASLDGRPTPVPPARPLSVKAIAHIHYAEGLEFDDEIRNQGPQGVVGFPDEYYIRFLKRALAGAMNDSDLNSVVGHIVNKFRARGSISAAIGTPEWRDLARMLAGVELEILARTIERDEGDFSGSPGLPILLEPLDSAHETDPAPLWELFAGYIRELKRSGDGRAAERRWRPVIKNLETFLGHDDTKRITRSDLQKWKDSLIETLSPRTVRDVYMAAIKAILTWAADNDRITTNPAKGIKVRTKVTPKNREKGFTQDEARQILRAAQEHIPTPSRSPATRESAHMTAAKRWLPWLCAFTGARITEIAQLRKADVKREGDIAYIRLTPDARSIKTDHYRDVPLHHQLIETGFLEFVASSPDGPLFYSTHGQLNDKKPRANTVAERVSTWIRKTGIIDKDVQPSHGWRHRMKTIGREIGIDARVLDAIQGHAGRTSSDGYGDVTLKTRATAINRFPRIEC